MELRDVLYKKRVYFDAGVFACLLEGFESSTSVFTDLKDMIVKDEIDVFTCDQVFIEVVPLCTLKENFDLKDDIIDFINTFNPSGTNFRKLREKGYKKFGRMTPIRSLHMMSAIENNCDVFLTDDPEIKVPDGMKLVLFSDYENKLDQKPISSGACISGVK